MRDKIVSNQIKTVLKMTGEEANRFFLKKSSYSNLELPNYISFESILNKCEEIYNGVDENNRDIDYIKNTNLGDIQNLNYTIYINKDGHHSWRPITLINPFIYVDLVNYITLKQDDNSFDWESLKERFSDFQRNDKIKCFSIPGEAIQSNKTDDGINITNWWKNIEQKSISNGLKYSYCLFTDITNFYPSIYTHSICWAIHGKEKTKNNLRQSKNWYGGKIDSKIQHMQYNQTNGIPQGSAIMDFIAEIILGYVDLKLSEVLLDLKKTEGIEIIDYSILRYRDDYRIFSNNKNELEIIAKNLQEVLQTLNLELNSKKTFLSENIIFDSIKPDKRYWESKRQTLRNSYLNKEKYDKGVVTLQKHLLEIKELANRYPNCGMIKKSLTEFYEERVNLLDDNPEDLEVLVSILVNIMLENPIAIPHCITIISKLYNITDNSISLNLITDILNKYSKKSNIEYVEIWLQRLVILNKELDFANDINFSSNIVKYIFKLEENLGKPLNETKLEEIFYLKWLDEIKIGVSLDEINSIKLVDKNEYDDMSMGVSLFEIDIFKSDVYNNM